MQEKKKTFRIKRPFEEKMPRLDSMGMTFSFDSKYGHCCSFLENTIVGQC